VIGRARPALTAVFVSALVLAAVDARAQPSEPLSTSTETGPVESPRSVKLFDSRRTTPSMHLELGPVWYREAKPTRDDYERGTGEILVGVALTTHEGPFFLSGYQDMHLRVLDSKTFVFSLLTTQMGAGLRVGPFEPEARVGFSILTLDVFHGHYSAEMLSPRVGAGIGIHLGKIRLDIATHSEYLWRWFGPDYLIRGVSLGLRLDVTRPKGPDFSDKPR
jgi:hypothetical protein